MNLAKEKSPCVAPAVASPSSLPLSVGIEDITTKSAECQAQNAGLVAFSEDEEIEQKFVPKRSNAVLLGESYERLGMFSNARRVAECGTLLEFAHAIDKDGFVEVKGNLHRANFCKDRLCPLCAWRRSYKIFAQVSQIMEKIGSEYEFLFLTLTVPSVSGEMLSETISRLLRGWDTLTHRKRVKTAVKGYFRALEITRNNDSKSKSYGLYHPHFHCVLAVDKQYFHKSGCYIKREEWLEMWRACYGDSSITQVDIRKAKDKYNAEAVSASARLSSAVAEIAKYSVKSSDYIKPDDNALTDEIVSTLALSLRSRRLSAYGGVFKTAFEKLKLDDAEDGDLVHLNEKISPAVAWLIIRYGWSAGAYNMLESFVEVNSPSE